MDQRRGAVACPGRVGHAAARVHDEHRALRAEFAAATGMPSESVTLSTLLDKLPLPADSIHELWALRTKLRRDGEEAQRLVRGNAYVAGQQLAFLEGFFVELAGGQQDARRYGPQGSLQPAACGSVIEARG